MVDAIIRHAEPLKVGIGEMADDGTGDSFRLSYYKNNQLVHAARFINNIGTSEQDLPYLGYINNQGALNPINSQALTYLDNNQLYFCFFKGDGSVWGTRNKVSLKVKDALATLLTGLNGNLYSSLTGVISNTVPIAIPAIYVGKYHETQKVLEINIEVLL